MKDPKYEINCIVCGNLSHKKIYDKSKICEDPRADHFLSAAKFFHDEVYTSIADLQTSSSQTIEDKAESFHRKKVKTTH